MAMALPPTPPISVAASPPATKGYKPPEWLNRPTADDLRAVFPAKAMQRGVSGSVILSCTVNIHGLAEGCRAESETPAGYGFGGAALLLTPGMFYKPATQDGTPVASIGQVRIKFETNGVAGNAPARTFTLIHHPVWASALGFSALAKAYPKRGRGTAGLVAIRCVVGLKGQLSECYVVREAPDGQGFGDAALTLVPGFKLVVSPEIAALKEPGRVNVTLRLIDPASDEFKERRITSPVWTAGLDPERAQKLFPAQAAAQGLKTGLGVARCRVAPDGALTECRPQAGQPDGLGFSEAAVEVAQVMKMSPWTGDGGPVDGAMVNLPIRFNLAAAKADEKPAGQ